VSEVSKQGGDLAVIGKRLAEAIEAYSAAVEFVVSQYRQDVRAVFAGSVPYLKLAGIVHGGWQLARSARAASAHLAAGTHPEFMRAKIATARFFADHVLVTAPTLAECIVAGSAGTLALAEEQF